MRLELIVNVTASGVNPRLRVAISQVLAAHHDLEVAFTSARGHATELAAEAAEDGRDVVVVFGGDGTLNEAANGLHGTGTALAVLPGGSTNVYARTIGMRRDPMGAAEQLLDALHEWDVGGRDPRRRVGLGVVNGRRFLVNLGIGFDAAVVERVERRSALKRFAGQPFFVLSTLQTLARGYDRRHPRMLLGIEGGPMEEGRFAVVLNSDPYTYLGRRPIHLAPDIDADAGLTVVLFTRLSARSLTGVLGRALGSGRRVARHPHVTVHSGVSRLEVVAGVPAGLDSGPVPHQVDGDYLGPAEKLAVEHVPACLDVVIPGTGGRRRGRLRFGR